eukprot:scaffold32954_cov67-Skeletonema_dohrnii-CCMP3373.AAC.1
MLAFSILQANEDAEAICIRLLHLLGTPRKVPENNAHTAYNIMFSTNQQQQSNANANEPIPASKNVSAWESLISDLESHGEDDDGEEGGGFLNGGASSSLPLSARSGNGGDEEKMKQESEKRENNRQQPN